jgi:hypothetical protein
MEEKSFITLAPGCHICCFSSSVSLEPKNFLLPVHECRKTFYGRNLQRIRRNSVKIIEKYATSGVITTVKSLKYYPLDMNVVNIYPP